MVFRNIGLLRSIVMKKKRIENKILIESYRRFPCEVCGNRENVVAHHVRSKGSGGHDIECNLIPLCFNCHRSIHDMPTSKFAQEHYPFLNWLNLNGWEQCELTGKWINKEAGV